LNIVDLPAPLGPMIAWMLPGATVKDTPDSALIAPNRTLTSSTSTAGMSVRRPSVAAVTTATG
jgi:hypothetical protein